MLSAMKMGRREARRWMLMRNALTVDFVRVFFLGYPFLYSFSFLFFHLPHTSALRLIHLPLFLYACSIHTFYL